MLRIQLAMWQLHLMDSRAAIAAVSGVHGVDPPSTCVVAATRCVAEAGVDESGVAPDAEEWEELRWKLSVHARTAIAHC